MQLTEEASKSLFMPFPTQFWAVSCREGDFADSHSVLILQGKTSGHRRCVRRPVVASQASVVMWHSMSVTEHSSNQVGKNTAIYLDSIIVFYYGHQLTCQTTQQYYEPIKSHAETTSIGPPKSKNNTTAVHPVASSFSRVE